MARLLVVEGSGELAALIAAAAASRGHSARTALNGQGALSALAAERFDAAVVDLVLSDLTGGEVLARLAALGVPVIALGAGTRPDGPAKETARTMGVQAFFERPFPMAALLQAVELLTDLPVTLSGDDEEEPDPAGFDVMETEPEADPAVTTPASLAPINPTPDELLEMDDEFATLAAKAAKDASPFEAGYRGALGPGAVPRLLLALARSRDSGMLVLRTDDQELRIGLRDGQPAVVGAMRIDEGIARFAAALGQLPEDALPEIDARVAQGEDAVEAMVALNFLSDADRPILKSAFLRARIYPAFFWSQGEYLVTRAGGDVAAGTEPTSALSADFVFEGLLQPQPLEWLREALPAERRLYPTLDAAFAHHQITLGPEQAALLSQVDGTKTVADLLVLTDLPEEQILSTLMAFAYLGLIEERAPESSSRRISFGL